MIAGNRRAGMLVVGLVVVLLVLGFLMVSRAHWKARDPVPQKPVISFDPTVFPCTAPATHLERIGVFALGD